MNTQECCDTPRGFVGGTCDYCGGTVPPEDLPKPIISRNTLPNNEKQLIREANDLRCELQNMKASRNKWRNCCEVAIIALIILTLTHFSIR